MNRRSFLYLLGSLLPAVALPFAFSDASVSVTAVPSRLQGGFVIPEPHAREVVKLLRSGNVIRIFKGQLIEQVAERIDQEILGRSVVG